MIDFQARNKILNCFGVFIILIMMCILPMMTELYSYNKRRVSVEEENVQYVSIKNTCVTQKIYLQGYISNLAIAFYAPSGALYEDADIEMSLVQGKQSVTESVRASRLRTLCAYDTDEETGLEVNEKSEMTYVLKSSLRSFSTGEAVLSIKCDCMPDGTDLFCKVSDTVISGLPSAMADANFLGHPLVISYDVFYINAHFYYETIFLVLLIGVLAGTSIIFVYGRKLLDRGAAFWCAFAVIFLTVSIRNPYAAFWGEPRSEAAYEFWYKAEHLGLLKSMMSLMSGEALAWLERIFMWAANILSPTKYVFKCAQLIELCWIAFVTALPCSIQFRLYFSDFIRLIFSVFIGTALLFDSAYYFWSCSYWGIIFFIMFALLPMDELKKSWFMIGLVLTVILCISRIYYIVLVPVALFLVLTVGRKKGKRFMSYCFTVCLSCGFETVYSLFSAESLTGTTNFMQGISQIGLLRLISNTLYYQVQILNSFFFGNVHWQGSGTNVLFLILLLVVVIWFVLLVKRKQYGYACYFGSLGFISLSTIAINVYVSGTHAAVSFPKNYAAKVDWAQNYYQNADLHFSFAYVCVVFLLMAMIFMCRIYVQANLRGLFDKNAAETGRKVSIGIFALINILMISISLKPRLTYEDKGIVVEWDSIAQITKNKSYFAAINVFYEAAPISLEKKSDEMIFGMNPSRELYLWQDGMERYEMKLPYSEADVGEVSGIGEKEILSVTARSAITNFDVRYAAVFKDKDGNELARVMQAEKEYRLWRTYLLPEPVKNVYSISFELEDGSTAYVENAIQIGYIVDSEKGRRNE